jgi:hypothetical protein
VLCSRRPSELSNQSESVEENLSYWKERLSGCSDVLFLPTDRPRPARRTNRSAQQTRRVQDSLLEKLRSPADQEHATLFEVLLSAFHALLHRYTGSREIVISTPASRQTAQTLLLLRTDVSGDPALRELLAQVREDLREARADTGIRSSEPIQAMTAHRLFKWRFRVARIAWTARNSI